VRTAPLAPGTPAGLEVTELPLSIESAKFDLSLALAASGAGLSGSLEYSRDLFDATTARRMVGHLCALFQGAAEAPDLRLSELPLLAPWERAQALWEWSDTTR